MEIDILKIVMIIDEIEEAVSFNILAEIPSGPAAFETSRWDSMSKILSSVQQSETSLSTERGLGKSSLDRGGIEELKFFANCLFSTAALEAGVEASSLLQRQE